MANNKDNIPGGSKVKRYAKVSTTAINLLTKMAGQKYLKIDINKPEHAKKLMESLGDLKGPVLKVAQLLATIPEALPKEYAIELQKLQSQAPSMGWPFVRRRMSSELGDDWQSKFKSFDREAIAAASLGQVHKAVTLDDKDVACKLQYPDMISAVKADLSQLKLIMGLFESYDNSISTSEMQKEIADRLHEELDYELEAKYMQLYKYILKKEKYVHVPEFVSDVSSERLLTSTWLDGKHIMDFIDAPQKVRNKIALNMFRAWYVPFYYYGIIHGDPHLGNYTVRDDLSINLLDFGCVRIFPASFVEGVITLYKALETDDEDMAVSAYENWGFENLNKEMIVVLNKWARFLYGPILDNKKRPIGVVTEGMYGLETARDVHKELKKIGGIKLPREFVFMDRAALGLGSVFLHLRSEVNWHKLFNEFIKDFDVKKVAQRQKKILEKLDIKNTS